uniref:hypothetical protein n=1 Tax=Methylobacterium sp. B34 TaxID=95563 RepID=UPI000FE148DD|nr:hypothetical protein [Methylobacterium sp. B34]
MPNPIMKAKYHLVNYVATREAARLSGIAEHILLEAVCDQIIDGINIPGKGIFVRWEDCSANLPSAAMAHNLEVASFAGVRARRQNYRNSGGIKDARHVGGPHGDASCKVTILIFQLRRILLSNS